MPCSPRPLASLALASLALFAAGCGSSNKGKIEGKWKMVSTAKKGEQEKNLEGTGLSFILEFAPDGNLNAGIDFGQLGGKDESPEGPVMQPAGKYKLLSGDQIEFSMMGGDKKDGGGLLVPKDNQRAKVKISGDTMTMTGEDVTSTFARMK